MRASTSLACCGAPGVSNRGLCACSSAGLCTFEDCSARRIFKVKVKTDKRSLSVTGLRSCDRWVSWPGRERAQACTWRGGPHRTLPAVQRWELILLGLREGTVPKGGCHLQPAGFGGAREGPGGPCSLLSGPTRPGSCHTFLPRAPALEPSSGSGRCQRRPWVLAA